MAVTHVFTPAISQLTTSGAAPPTKAYTSAVSAGDLLWCFVWVNSATTTVTGVSDSVNGSWTQAFGPVRGDATNFNASLYGFYKANSAAGTPTLTVTTSANTQGGYVFGAINGLSGGGALDQYLSQKLNGALGSGWQLTSSALAQAIEAGVGIALVSSTPGTTLWTADATLDSVNFERVSRTVTASTAAQTFGSSGGVGGGTTGTLGAMLFKDAASPPTMTGDMPFADMVLSGSFATGALSQLSSGFTLDDFVLGGVLGLAPGIVTTQPFKNWSGTLLPGVAVPNVVFIKLDRTQALALTNQTTGGDGVMIITNAALVTGVYYIMVSFDAAGTSIGAELVLAA